MNAIVNDVKAVHVARRGQRPDPGSVAGKHATTGTLETDVDVDGARAWAERIDPMSW